MSTNLPLLNNSILLHDSWRKRGRSGKFTSSPLRKKSQGERVNDISDEVAANKRTKGGRGQKVVGMCIHRERWSYGGSYRRVITLIAAIKWQQHPRGVATAPRRLFSLHTHTPAPSDRGQRGEGHVCPNPCHIVKYNPRFVWFATVNRVKGSRDTSQWTGTASFIYRLLIISKKAPRSPIKLGKFRRCVGFFWFGNAEILIEDDNRSCGDCDIVRFENGPLFGGLINRRINFGEISSTIRGFRRMGDLLISSVMSCFLYICEIL